MSIDERRRARPAIEILVSAADREIGAGSAQCHRHGTGAVSQIPDDERARGPRLRRDARQIVHGAGAIIDVREHKHRKIAIDQTIEFARRVDQRQLLVAPRAGDRVLRHVEVGGKVMPFGDDPRSRRAQIERCAIGTNDIARFGADQRRDACADSSWQIDPICGIPRPDEPIAPLHIDGFAKRGPGSMRQRPERIAVEIDETVRQAERATLGGQRIDGVEAGGIFAVGHSMPFPIRLRARQATRT